MSQKQQDLPRELWSRILKIKSWTAFEKRLSRSLESKVWLIHNGYTEQCLGRIDYDGYFITEHYMDCVYKVKTDNIFTLYLSNKDPWRPYMTQLFIPV